ncbi:MAG: hypothetical protein WCV91_07410 [Candidatus Margulisiibacteriota bacterium]
MAATDTERQEAIYLKGYLLYSINENRDALAMFLTLGSDSPFYRNSILPIARSYIKLGMADEGLAFLAEAATKASHYPKYIVLECQAKLLYIKGDPTNLKEALQAAKEAIGNAERAGREQAVAHIQKKLIPSIQARLDKLEPPPPHPLLT